MKWALIGKRHVNMNNVDVFYWQDGILLIFFVGEESAEKYKDPDRERYIKLCRQQGIRPYEEE